MVDLSLEEGPNNKSVENLHVKICPPEFIYVLDQILYHSIIMIALIINIKRVCSLQI